MLRPATYLRVDIFKASEPGIRFSEISIIWYWTISPISTPAFVSFISVTINVMISPTSTPTDVSPIVVAALTLGTCVSEFERIKRKGKNNVINFLALFIVENPVYNLNRNFVLILLKKSNRFLLLNNGTI